MIEISIHDFTIITVNSTNSCFNETKRKLYNGKLEKEREKVISDRPKH